MNDDDESRYEFAVGSMVIALLIGAIVFFASTANAIEPTDPVPAEQRNDQMLEILRKAHAAGSLVNQLVNQVPVKHMVYEEREKLIMANTEINLKFHYMDTLHDRFSNGEHTYTEFLAEWFAYRVLVSQNIEFIGDLGREMEKRRALEEVIPL